VVLVAAIALALVVLASVGAPSRRRQGSVGYSTRTVAALMTLIRGLLVNSGHRRSPPCIPVSSPMPGSSSRG
jgi:hypothetical protein